MSASEALSRSSCASHVAATVGIAHFGLGAFHRAHQAWYTEQTDVDGEWGIAAFSGRSAALPTRLSAQDGLYTLLVRDSERDSASVIDSIVRARPGSDLTAVTDVLGCSETRVATLTITEAGYASTVDGGLDLDRADVQHDLQILARLSEAGSALFEADVAGMQPRTTPARIALGLEARRRADAGPITLVSCDNMPANGLILRRVIEEFAGSVGEELATWIASSVSFVTTSVDRITPATTVSDIEIARALTGFDDAVPVVAEPFTDWVLSGSFPSGRPLWENAGARFVDDIDPWERRKLWLLNGAHSLLSYSGLLRGHETVAEAVQDHVIRDRMSSFWSEAMHHLPDDDLDLDRYVAQLIARFENTRIEHRLRQIAMDGATKVAVRIAPVALAERSAGRSAEAAASVYAEWIRALRTVPGLSDSRMNELYPRVCADDHEAARSVVAITSEELAADEAFVVVVAEKMSNHA